MEKEEVVTRLKHAMQGSEWGKAMIWQDRHPSSTLSQHFINIFPCISMCD